MRIVHVAPFYHPVIGGVEEVVKRVAEYMACKGNEVHVLTYNRLRIDVVGSLPREETINNVHVIRLKPNFTWSHGTYSTELPDAIIKLRPDIIHVHVWRHPHVFQVARLKEKLNFKAVLHAHAPFHTFSQLGLTTWLYHRAVDLLMKNALRNYDSIIALTPHEKAILTGKLSVQEEKVVIIPNGINDEFINSARNTLEMEPLAVLYLGRISGSKNVDLLLKAMRYVKKKIAKIKLVMAGPDEGLVMKLRHYAEKHNINFQYLGIVSESKKYTLYCKCAVFVHPAIYEPLGITLLEAQAFGKPCVITGEGGQVYAAPLGRTSLYAKPNPKDFGEAITLLLNDKRLYEKLSINAREWASLHSWSKILPKYDEVYR